MGKLIIPSETFVEAPINGNSYIRKDGSWALVTLYTPPTNQGADYYLAGDGAYKEISIPVMDIISIEVINIPIAGWGIDATYGDFYSIIVPIAETLTVNDSAKIIPILNSAAKKLSYDNMELAMVDRETDSSIKLYAISVPTTTFDCELHIIRDGGS